MTFQEPGTPGRRSLRKSHVCGGPGQQDLSFLHRLVQPVELATSEEIMRARSGSLADGNTSRGMPLKDLGSDGATHTIASIHELKKTGVLGKGFQGEVLRMVHSPSGRQLAVKVCAVRTELDRRTLREEIRILASFRNEYIVTFYGAFYRAAARPHETASLHSIFELMDGGCLHNAITHLGPVPESVLSQLIRHCLHGLKFLHSQSVLHRDIKSQNILLCVDSCVAKLTDFGLSKEADFAKSFRGTVEYMSPERLRGQQYTAAADLWSLGIVVVEALHGRHPFPDRPSYWDYASESSAESDHLFGRMDIGGSPELRDFVRACTRHKMGDRGTAVELLAHDWIWKHCGDADALRAWLQRLRSTGKERSLSADA